MSAGITRREAILGLATVGAIAAAPASAAIATVDRRQWDVAMAALAEAQRQSDAFDDRVDAVNAAYRTAAEAVPHTTIRGGALVGTFSTANRTDISVARSEVRRLAYVEDLPGNYDRFRAYHQLLKAADERDAKLAQIDKRLGWTKINDRYDELTNKIVEAEAALLAMPAPDGEALMWKVQKLYKPGDGVWEADYEQQTHADLRRFLLSGRA